MGMILWRFWLYSFLGYLLEKAFAAATASPHQTRKCFLLLPLCPVYGLAVLAVLALSPTLRDGFWRLAFWGGAAATAVEYAVHWLYERGLGVQFWDYSALPGNVRGRVCLLFSIIWGLLLAAGLPWAEENLVPLLERVPPLATYGLLLVFTADAVCSVRFLQVTRDVDAL